MNLFNLVSISLEIDACASDPCMHGATCSDLIAGYSCDYTKGYTVNTGVLKMTPVGVNRGPHSQVLKLHPRV